MSVSSKTRRWYGLCVNPDCVIIVDADIAATETAPFKTADVTAVSAAAVSAAAAVTSSSVFLISAESAPYKSAAAATAVSLDEFCESSRDSLRERRSGS
jgi:hypothetical protein